MTMLLAEKKDNGLLIGYGFNKLLGLKNSYILLCSINALPNMLKSKKCLNFFLDCLLKQAQEWSIGM